MLEFSSITTIGVIIKAWEFICRMEDLHHVDNIMSTQISGSPTSSRDMD
jgi:hypothetical protein